MKLNDFNEEIAKTCELRAKSVAAVQKETFRRLREMLEKGERVTIPGFGIFSTKERTAADSGEVAKILRFKLVARNEAATDVSGEDRKARRQAKKAKKTGAAEEGGETESEDTAAATDAAQ